MIATWTAVGVAMLSFVACTGSAGPAGDMGEMGTAGTMGTMGNPGIAHNALIETSVEPAGANCAAGGMRFQAGIDANDDGMLQPGEVNSAATQYVCNGPQGSNAALPAGVIAMFAGACPAGWTEYMPMRGRFARGEPTGDPTSLGTGGTDNAVVVAHTHTASMSTSTDGSHAHLEVTTANGGACPGSGIIRTTYTGDTVNACAYETGATTDPAGAHSHSVSGSTDSAGVSGVGMNMPSYAEVLYCRKQ